MGDDNGAVLSATYSSFAVTDASDKYKYKYRLTVSGYGGDAGYDELGYQNNQQFSAKDQDNNSHSSDCAQTYHGGWWYGTCHGHGSNLNGI